MDFNFDFRRLLLFAILLGGLALIGGFSKPDMASNSVHNAASVRKAWTYCIALYVIGAAAASLVDHWTGTMELANLRLLYILLGVLLMLAGGLWLRSLKEAVESTSVTSHHGHLRKDRSHVDAGTPFLGSRSSQSCFCYPCGHLQTKLYCLPQTLVS